MADDLSSFLGVTVGSWLGFGGFFRRDRVVKFLDVLGGVSLEIVVATFAAKLDFATFMHECVRLAHTAEFAVADKAGFQRVGDHIGIRRCAGCQLFTTTTPGKNKPGCDAAQ
ncbi:MAG TPA: hypothetical protein EYG44_04545 [Verrucomicrobia bacterium]|nr:hypothetical protein [Verrucomicrobiota bacterium]